MTVVTREQAAVILSALPKLKNCDACSTPLGADRMMVPYGPFTVDVCPRCEWKIKKFRWKEKRIRAGGN